MIIIDNVLESHLEIIREMKPLEPPSGDKSLVIIIYNVLEPHIEIKTELIPLEPPLGGKYSITLT